VEKSEGPRLGYWHILRGNWWANEKAIRSGRPTCPFLREKIEELWSLDVCSKIQPGSSHLEE